MKRILFVGAFYLSCLTGLGQDFDEAQLETIKDYFTNLKDAASAMDSEQLNDLICPAVMPNGYDIRDQRVKRIISEMEKGGGEMFKIEAIDKIIESVYKEFIPIPAPGLEAMMKNPAYNPTLDGLETSSVPYLKKGKTEIMLVNQEGKIMLMYYDNLNQLLSE